MSESSILDLCQQFCPRRSKLFRGIPELSNESIYLRVYLCVVTHSLHTLDPLAKPSQIDMGYGLPLAVGSERDS